MKSQNKHHLVFSLVLGLAFLFTFAFSGIAQDYGQKTEKQSSAKVEAPAKLSVKHTDDHNIKLSWHKVADASKYNIYRAKVHKKISGDISRKVESGDIDFKKIATTQKIEFTDEGYTKHKMKSEQKMKKESKKDYYKSHKEKNMKSMTEAEYSFIYYVTAVDNQGNEGRKSNFANLNVDGSQLEEHKMTHEKTKSWDKDKRSQMSEKSEKEYERKTDSSKKESEKMSQKMKKGEEKRSSMTEGYKKESLEISEVKTHIENENYSEAMNMVDNLIQKDSTNAELLFQKARILHGTGKTDKAIDTYKRSLKFNEDPYVLNNLGYLYIQENRFADAVPVLEKAVQKKSDESHFYNNLGIAQENLGNDQEAIQAYQKALDINPEDQKAQQNLERLRQNSNQSQQQQRRNR